MSILVTGCAGFIGSHLVEKLLRSGEHVVGIDSFETTLYPIGSRLDRFTNFEKLDSFQGFRGDLSHPSTYSLIENYEFSIIYNFAAIPGLVPSWEKTQDYIRCNVSATDLLTDFAIRKSAKLIHASTSSVYGFQAVGDETTETKPVSPYGITKLAAEKLVESKFAWHKLRNYTVARIFSVYGPRQRPDMAYSKFISAALKGDPVEVYGDGTQLRSNTYIDDIVRAFLLMAEPNCDGYVFNVAGAETVNLLQVIDIIEGLAGSKLKLKFGDVRTGDQKITSGDSALLREITNWLPKVSIQQGLFEQFQAAKNEI